MRKGEKKRRWTAEERAFVVANYGRMSHGEIAKHLGRSTIAVQAFARRFRLVKDAQPTLEVDPEALTPAQVRTLVQRVEMLERAVAEYEEEREGWLERIDALEGRVAAKR